MLARQAGMSYGKWKAMQPIVEVKEKPMPEEYRTCEYCGEIIGGDRRKRFCNDDCRRQAYYDKELAIQREYQRKRRARLKAGAGNAG